MGDKRGQPHKSSTGGGIRRNHKRKGKAQTSHKQQVNAISDGPGPQATQNAVGKKFQHEEEHSGRHGDPDRNQRLQNLTNYKCADAVILRKQHEIAGSG